MAEVYAVTDIGKRKSNQDSYWIAKLGIGPDTSTGGAHDAENPSDSMEGTLIVVADGMGGLADGAYASQETLRILKDTIVNRGIDNTSITDALNAANTQLFNEGRERGERMGTTCTLLMLANGVYNLYHVGDSRCYRIRKDNVYKVLTQDETAYEMGMKSGAIILKEDGRTALFKGKERPIGSLKSLLTNCIGAKGRVNITFEEGTYSEGDLFLISSDGFWHNLESNPQWQIKLRRAGEHSESYLKSLIEKAKSGIEKDNLTVVLARM